MTHIPMNVCWIDLETTGTDEHHGSIVEIGAIITGPDLSEIESVSLLVQPDPDHWHDMVNVARGMHERSGLAADIEEAMDFPDGGNALPVDDADRILRGVLDRHSIRGQVILAGSGVSHFDHRWIRLHLPRSATKLTWWAWDVGNVRRFLASIDPSLPRPLTGPKAHRGVADARDHLSEWVHYRTMIRDAITLDQSTTGPTPLVDTLAPNSEGQLDPPPSDV